MSDDLAVRQRAIDSCPHGSRYYGRGPNRWERTPVRDPAVSTRRSVPAGPSS
jgi:hypothetical protein